MSDWNLSGNTHRSIFYPSGTADGTVISTGNPAGTKGAWATVISSTPFDCYITFGVTNQNIYQDYLVDIAIGAAGSERIIASNIAYCHFLGLYQFGRPHYTIPIFIPAGVRVAFRASSSVTASQSLIICVGALAVGDFIKPQLGSFITTYSGTPDPGATPNTKAAWVQFSASTTYKGKGLFASFHGRSNSARLNYNWRLDIGVGGAGSESVIVYDFILVSNTSTSTISPMCTPFFHTAIPAGSRLAARTQCTGADATDRLFDMYIHILT